MLVKMETQAAGGGDEYYEVAFHLTHSTNANNIPVDVTANGKQVLNDQINGSNLGGTFDKTFTFNLGKHEIKWRLYSSTYQITYFNTTVTVDDLASYDMQVNAGRTLDYPYDITINKILESSLFMHNAS